jgi:hypothetical protein
MNPAASLPAASPSTVLAVFLRIEQAADKDTFRREDLQEHGIAQFRQAVTLLRFLRLTTDAGLLEEDVCRVRRDSLRFRELLRNRFQAACREAGFWSESLQPFGCEELSRSRLTDVLTALPPIQRQNSPAARTNMIGCLRTLHSVILHGDRDWLAKNYDARQAVRREPARSAVRDRCSLEPRPDASRTAVREPLDSPSLPDDVVVDHQRLHVGYTDEGDDIFVDAWFSPPLASLTRQQRLTLAKRLQRFAGDAETRS